MTTISEQVRELQQRAEALLARGLFDQAGLALTSALTLDPNASVARLTLALVLRNQAQYGAAIEQLARLTTSHPEWAEPWWLLAMVHWDAGDRPRAAIPAAQYAARRPEDSSAQVRAAEILMDLGQFDIAAPLLDRARVLDPTNAEIKYLLGRLLFEEGNTEAAIQTYTDAIRLAPRLGEAAGGRVLEAWLIEFHSWSENSAGEYHEIEPSGFVQLPAPSVIPGSQAGPWRAGPTPIPAIFVGKLDNAEVPGREFPVLAPDGCFFINGFVTSPAVYLQKGVTVKYASGDGRVLLDLPSAPLEAHGPCLLLGRSSNYFHFLLESVPRIWSAEQIGIPGETKALVPPDLVTTQLELLQLLGFPQSRLIPVPHDSSIRCKTLFAPSLLGETFAISPHAIEFLRSRILNRFPQMPHLPKRVYLSRNRMPRRRVTNESELVTVLEQHGFSVVHPETLGLDEQVRMFAQAEAILSPDSSALSNVVFASPGTRVGVFSSREWGLHKPLWHCIARLVNADLTYIYADSIPESNAMISHRDMRVEPELLEAWLAVL